MAMGIYQKIFLFKVLAIPADMTCLINELLVIQSNNGHTLPCSNTMPDTKSTCMIEVKSS